MQIVTSVIWSQYHKHSNKSLVRADICWFKSSIKLGQSQTNRICFCSASLGGDDAVGCGESFLIATDQGGAAADRERSVVPLTRRRLRSKGRSSEGVERVGQKIPRARFCPAQQNVPESVRTQLHAFAELGSCQIHVINRKRLSPTCNN